MPSDKELAKLLLREAVGDADDPIGWEEIGEAYQAFYLRSARALRAALLPDVAPLAPGDYVDIGANLRAFHDVEDGDFGVMVWDDDDRGARTFVDERIAYLDAAGVRALRTACDRWLVGLEGDDE